MQWLNRVIVALLAIAALAYLPAELGTTAQDSEGVARVRDERDALAASNAELRQEIELLRAEVRALKEDPREVERIAREDLNMARPGEVVFEFAREASEG